MGATSDSAVRVVVVHPDLMGTYGDGGNALVLTQRLAWRGFDVELVQAASDRPVPTDGDLYCLGGGEDGPQARSSSALGATGALASAHQAGAVIFAVCAGLQILGRSFPGADGVVRSGLGIVDLATAKEGRRKVGELVVEPEAALGLPTLTGYENHAGVTRLGEGVRPLGRVVVGTGNGAGDGAEGVVGDRVLGTYMHGPALARNPALADLILGWVVGTLDPLDDREEEALRAERLAAAGAARRWRPSWR